MNVRRRLQPAVYISGVILALGAILLAGHWTRTPTHVAAPLLNVHIDGDHVHVSWNPDDPRLRPADNGVLTIVDGNRQRTIPVSTAELRSRNGITFVPASDKVTVALQVSGSRTPPQEQSVLAVLRPAHPQVASVQRTPVEEQPPHSESADRMANAPEQRPEGRRLFQVAAVKYRSGEGLRSGAYRPAQPTREATPRVPDHFAKLLTTPVEIDVRIKVDRHGNVVTARPVSQTGSLRASSDDQVVLAHAVLDAAKQWRFMPAELHSRPVPSELILSFRFMARG